MDLNTVNIEIRPRPPYEGLDLGFIMASRWFLRLWGLWALTALPVCCIILIVFHKSPAWGALIIWWLKPVFETPLLYWISRKVFNEDPRIRPMLKNMTGILKPQLIRRLTTRRLSPSRSFFMPVMLLENMRGRDYVTRTDILGRNQSAALVLTFICLLFEMLLYFSVIGLCQMLIPETFEVSIFDSFFGDSLTSWLASNMLGIISMSVVAPYYICAGFALYISRRTALEAWDIEMNFKRLIKRKQQNKGSGGAAILLICGMILMSGAGQLEAAERHTSQSEAAQTARGQAKQIIAEVLANADFGREETVTYWELKDFFRDRERKNYQLPDFFRALAEFFAMVAKPLIWAACGTLAVFLIYYLSTYTGTGNGLPAIRKTKPPRELFGLKITAESLPADIMAEIDKLLEAKDFRAALSLLYRGTLYRLVFETLIDIPASATEGECIRLVENHTDAETAVFFKTLTGVWLKLAYGHIQPDLNTVESLCNTWQRLYGGAAKANG
ncbi:MAG: DUF4129 domain-containing protein [Desulfobacterales bacterium]|nr:DUF4129 domain-containing protein [Desulfobacterales bacterium]